MYNPVFQFKDTTTIEYTKEQEDALLSFCSKCEQLEYINTSSLNHIKLERMTYPHGNFWATYKNNEIISAGGIERMYDLGDNIWRLLTRSATLPDANLMGIKYPSKNFFKASFNFAHFINIQLLWVNKKFPNPNNKFIITTNNSNTNKIDSAGKGFRMHDTILPLLARQNLVKRTGKDIEIHYCLQDVYELNVQNYYNMRDKLI